MEPTTIEDEYSTEIFHSLRLLEDLRIEKRTVQEQSEVAEKKSTQGVILTAKADAFIHGDRFQKWFVH